MTARLDQASPEGSSAQAGAAASPTGGGAAAARRRARDEDAVDFEVPDFIVGER